MKFDFISQTTPGETGFIQDLVNSKTVTTSKGKEKSNAIETEIKV